MTKKCQHDIPKVCKGDLKQLILNLMFYERRSWGVLSAKVIRIEAQTTI